MARGSKAKYTNKQKRQARDIERGYLKRGIGRREAARRAWATVNAETHGGKKGGSGRGKRMNYGPSRKGGRLGGHASARRPAAARSRSARKAAATRKRRRSHSQRRKTGISRWFS
ncbi:MAG TPA: plasmid stabilization protein [Xanthobacteraceae bacterium]|nr:plasmid stabilization protein [Xanthobacteraceae bacterium]